MENRKRAETDVKSVERGMKIVETIRERGGATVTEVANELGTAKSTVHGYLSTFHDLGYLINEGGTYHIGTKFLRIGEHSRTRREEYTMAAEKIQELAEQTDERSQFVIEEHGRGVFLYRGFGSHAVETGSETGKRMYLHSTSAGKSILAHLPEGKVEEIIDQWGLQSLTSNTITDKAELFEELADIRDRGYAFNREENIEGLRAVGVPLTSGQRGVIGALSISGPTHRMKGEWLRTDLPDLLLGTANELELNITYS